MPDETALTALPELTALPGDPHYWIGRYVRTHSCGDLDKHIGLVVEELEDQFFTPRVYRVRYEIEVSPSPTSMQRRLGLTRYDSAVHEQWLTEDLRTIAKTIARAKEAVS